MLPVWTGMTTAQWKSVRSTAGGMPDAGATVVLRGGITPGRRGNIAARDGDVPASDASARAGSALSPLEEGRGRSGESGKSEQRGKPPTRIGSSPDRKGSAAGYSEPPPASFAAVRFLAIRYPA